MLSKCDHPGMAPPTSTQGQPFVREGQLREANILLPKPNQGAAKTAGHANATPSKVFRSNTRPNPEPKALNRKSRGKILIAEPRNLLAEPVFALYIVAQAKSEFTFRCSAGNRLSAVADCSLVPVMFTPPALPSNNPVHRCECGSRLVLLSQGVLGRHFPHPRRPPDLQPMLLPTWIQLRLFQSQVLICPLIWMASLVWQHLLTLTQGSI